MSRPVRVVLAIFAWWVLVVLPAVLSVAGVFGDAGPDNTGLWWLLGTWTVFYLAQLAWLMLVVSRAVGHLRQSWMFISSLLPWAVDWAAPYGPGWGLLWIGIAGAVAGTMTLLALRDLSLEVNGRLVTATVVRVLRNRMNVVINNVYIRRRVLLAIPGADGTPYEAVLPMLCEIGTSPEPGDSLRLRVDPDNPKHFALDPSYRDHDRD